MRRAGDCGGGRHERADELDQPAAAGDDVGEDRVDPLVVRIRPRQLPRPHALELGVGGADQLAEAAGRTSQVVGVERPGELGHRPSSSTSPSSHPVGANAAAILPAAQTVHEGDRARDEVAEAVGEIVVGPPHEPIDGEVGVDPDR